MKKILEKVRNEKIMLQQVQCSFLCGYEMNQLNRTFTIHTHREEEWGTTTYRIVFVDVLAAWCGSIPDSETMISIHEISAERIWIEGERLFRSHNGEQWPMRFRNRQEFMQKVRSKFLRTFEIISDSGTSGWVISQDPIVTTETVKTVENQAEKSQ